QEVVRAPLFEKAVLPAIVRLGGPISFYTRHGDVFMMLCLLFLVVRIGVRCRYFFSDSVSSWK
ncbi:MAG: hypothetical protein HY542_06280, partial [Deltaproteobacteria bacterium]|nr:hypothetical protein [Deltaproteobacteria bacterium]